MAKKLKVPGTRNDFHQMEIEIRQNVARIKNILNQEQTEKDKRFFCSLLREDIKRGENIIENETVSEYENFLNHLKKVV